MNYLVLDFETTGLDYKTNQVTEVACKKFDESFKEIGSFHTLVKLKPSQKIDPYVEELTGLTHEDLKDGMEEIDALQIVLDFIDDEETIVVAQYAPFDLAYLGKYHIHPKRYICTKSLTAQVEPHESSSLVPTCERLGIQYDTHHRAMSDVDATVEVLKVRTQQDIEFVENYIVKSPDRELTFLPKWTHATFDKGVFMNE